MRFSVVVVNWNSREDLRRCLASLRAQTRDVEVIVVDNGSTDGSQELVKTEFPAFRLLAQTENLGFAEGCNIGIEASSGEWVATLNNDAIAEPDWAEQLITAAESAPDGCGMLQSLMLYQGRQNTINSTGVELTYSGGGRDRHDGQAFVPCTESEEIFCPTAGAAAYRRSMLDAIKLPEGYFDRAHFMYYEDTDLGWRARIAGWSAFYVPRSVVHHRWHGSSVRHGRSWLVVLATTNRIRTLLKNASVPFLLQTIPRSVKELAELIWHGGVRGLYGVFRAARESIVARSRVGAMARCERSAVERQWRARPA